MLNDVTLMGRLTADPELRTTNSGQSVCRFCLAVERSIRSADGERRTDFINCLAWAKTAEFLRQYFHKGQIVVAQGELQQVKWEKDGEIRQSYEVKVERVHFGGDKKNTDVPPAGGQMPEAVRRVEEQRAAQPQEPAYDITTHQVDLSGPAYTPEEDLPF